jgi:hypothetical protein
MHISTSLGWDRGWDLREDSGSVQYRLSAEFHVLAGWGSGRGIKIVLLFILFLDYVLQEMKYKICALINSFEPLWVTGEGMSCLSHFALKTALSQGSGRSHFLADSAIHGAS